jgi:hypothetical protein
MVKGAIFCQVKMRNPWNHSVEFITWGNQKWKGAIPILIIKDIKINLLNLWNIIEWDKIISPMEAEIKIIEARA